MDDQDMDLEYTDTTAVEDISIENFYLALKYALERLKEYNPAETL